MFELKKLSPESIGPALRKVERYRQLNEPWEAESICLDILEVQPDNAEALVSLLLARTDQFRTNLSRVSAAKELVERLPGEYQRCYYSGIIAERVAKAHLARHSVGSGPVAYEAFREAMDWYERAEALRPPGNDDAIVRWNTCARLLMRHADLAPVEDSGAVTLLE